MQTSVKNRQITEEEMKELPVGFFKHQMPNRKQRRKNKKK
jgi:hypothetical protein